MSHLLTFSETSCHLLSLECQQLTIAVDKSFVSGGQVFRRFSGQIETNLYALSPVCRRQVCVRMYVVYMYINLGVIRVGVQNSKIRGVGHCGPCK